MEVRVWARGLAERGRRRALQRSILICTIAKGPQRGTDGRVHMGQSFPHAKSGAMLAGLLFLLMCAFWSADGISSSFGLRSETPSPSSVSTYGTRQLRSMPYLAVRTKGHCLSVAIFCHLPGDSFSLEFS